MTDTFSPKTPPGYFYQGKLFADDRGIQVFLPQVPIEKSASSLSESARRGIKKFVKVLCKSATLHYPRKPKSIHPQIEAGESYA